MSRLEAYLDYHAAMVALGDLDPQYPALRYVAARFELNTEQRYWLAWLFATTYCVPTAFYMYNEFPDYENVDVARLARWWGANRARCLFQSDRLRVKTTNQFVPAFESYRALAQPTQEAWWYGCRAPRPDASYDAAFAQAGQLWQFGRYSLFLYLEAVAALTGFPMVPTGLDLRHAESSRNGLCYALGLDGWLTGHDYGRTTLAAGELRALQARFPAVLAAAQERAPGSTVWSVETSLCAFKKLQRGTRWLGYYVARQAEEIRKMERAVPEGVCWDVLWDFRRGHFAPELTAGEPCSV